jgi:dihydrofolate synthase/folylpolyglutamate synthase
LDIEEYVHYLQNLPRFGQTLSLERITMLLEALGHPEQKLHGIHVAGTNGKGSTSAMLFAVLKAAGYKVALYTSPHLVSYVERFRIGTRGEEKQISEREFASLLELLRPAIEQVRLKLQEAPTWFEVLTAMALQYFTDQQVEWAIMEVGMGGRMDATNIKDWEYKAITNVTLDHTQQLGDTIENIAYEKAGILHKQLTVDNAQLTNVVTACRGEALEVVKRVSADTDNGLSVMGEDFSGTFREIDWSVTTFDYSDGEQRWDGLKIPLIGQHQVDNAACALAILNLMKLAGDIDFGPDIVRKGLLETHWPGRIEVVPPARVQALVQRKSDDTPCVILDGAHNTDGVRTLIETLRSMRARGLVAGKIVCVFGAKRDKDVQPMLNGLHEAIDEFLFTPIHELIPSWKPHELVKIIGKGTSCDNPRQALVQGLEAATKDDVVLVCGSLYLIGEINKILGDNPALSIDDVAYNEDARRA